VPGFFAGSPNRPATTEPLPARFTSTIHASIERTSRFQKTMTRTLLSFAGFHDPGVPATPNDSLQPGPILTLIRDVGFERIILLRTPGALQNTNDTETAIRKIHPSVIVLMEDLALPDPTDYAAIFRELRRTLRGISEAESADETEYFIGIASGTPQMHAAWLLLVASGELPARILNTRPPKYVTSELPSVFEIDVYSGPFPTVRAYVAPEEEHAEDQVAALAFAVKEIGIVGEHPAFRRILQRAAIVAPTKYPVLILGETGTGKELLARLIHRLSGRTHDRFVPVNCAAIPKDLVESTLFGHQKGAFTGAHATQAGKFDAAQGGTLFLDELGELSAELQPKLLRVLQDSIVEPVGVPTGHKVDVRVITATNVDVQSAIRDGDLRGDLYYRLKVGVCHLPPLRQRRSDIPRLALFFLDRFNGAEGKSKRFSTEAMTWLRQQLWPGNIRELQNTIDSAALFAGSDLIEIPDLEAAAETPSSVETEIPEPAEGFNMQEYIAGLRKRLVERAMEMADGRQNRAAKLLGVSPQALSKSLQTKGNNKS
jgi:DNA-binding NtrC family response regulator